MAAAPGILSVPSYALAPFRPEYAPAVAAWVRDLRELLWLAPGTLAPLTAEKVIGWLGPTDQRFVLVEEETARPVGYSELNQMGATRRQMWIGHFILAPAVRGRGLATRFVFSLLDVAFARQDAGEVVLLVFPDNRRAIRCYERAGFVAERFEHRYFDNSRRTEMFLRMRIDRPTYQRAIRSTCGAPDPAQRNLARRRYQRV